jgi:AcrR family transcriptional regulator
LQANILVDKNILMDEELVKKTQPGLRERQRAARRQGILFAAGDLFATSGFEATSLEDVAARAEVSVPTIYSFFKSKQDLLLGLVEEDRQLSEPKLTALIADLPERPIDAFVEIGRAMFLQGYDVHQKAVWREIIAVSFKVAGDQKSRFRELQLVNARYIGAAIDKLCDAGRLRADLDRDSALRLIQGTIRRVFQTYVLSEDMSVDDMMELLLQDLRTLTLGLT